jgi:hypothetical protein
MTDFEDRVRRGLAALDREYTPTPDLAARIMGRTRQRDLRHRAAYGFVGCAATLALVVGMASALGLTSAGGRPQAGRQAQRRNHGGVSTSYESTSSSAAAPGAGAATSTTATAPTHAGQTLPRPASPRGASTTSTLQNADAVIPVDSAPIVPAPSNAPTPLPPLPPPLPPSTTTTSTAPATSTSTTASTTTTTAPPCPTTAPTSTATDPTSTTVPCPPPG